MKRSTSSREELLGSQQKAMKNSLTDLRNVSERPLTPQEKSFLLHADRGDCATVRRLISEFHPDSKDILDINCVDPLNRSALIAAIENENIELIRILLTAGILVKDALLHAIKEEYVEAVELLLLWEEENHIPGEPYSWEAVQRSGATFTADITPLILAAHRNHYEILKILLDRGATLPVPHDVRCGCDECVQSSTYDSLRHSQARINAYRALTSPSLIALSSKDPLLTAFELSWELRRLSRMETEFRAEYKELRLLCQEFATALLDHARTSTELEIMLNYNPLDLESWEPGERQTLERLKLAIKYKQKQFVAHPNVQQLLAAIWYEGLPGFRRKGIVGQTVQVAKFGMMFPLFSTIYMLAPNSEMGKFMKKPFVKFICHSSSYVFFLTLLGLASQRAEYLVLEWFGTPWMLGVLDTWKRRERGALPGFIEFSVILYVFSLIWAEIRSLWSGGILDYVNDLWNIVDFITNIFYITWICLRFSSWYIVQRDYDRGIDPWFPRERWDPYDPMLLSEGAFAAGMIFSFLKLVHIFSINPHLGPLQVSLGRMIIDIIKFFFIYTLVLFAFGCGLNQLMWYYADLEKNKCYHLPNGLPDFDNQEKACSIWRRYANLFETSQSLFWASFGLVDLMTFDLTGIKSFTRFWALLTFGSYSVINVIVLLNMLIAMMSNSYQIISERSDMEWKFARSTLWISYFDDGDTLPPPFNLIPTPKVLEKFVSTHCNKKSNQSVMKKSREKARVRHEDVMRILIRRYVTAEQRKRDEVGVTEDDVMEIRQDISTLRYELIDILRQNGMKTPSIDPNEAQLAGKKGRVMERRLLKDFQIGIVEGIIKDVISSDHQPKDVFSQIAKAIGKRSSVNAKQKDWNAMVRQSKKYDPIGSRSEAMRRSRQSLRKHILEDIEGSTIDPDKLIAYNPALSDVSNTTRKAYAKFMKSKLRSDFNDGQLMQSKTSVRSGASVHLEDEVFESPRRRKGAESSRAHSSSAIPRPKAKRIYPVLDPIRTKEGEGYADIVVESAREWETKTFRSRTPIEEMPDEDASSNVSDGRRIVTDAVVETESETHLTSIPESQQPQVESPPVAPAIPSHTSDAITHTPQPESSVMPSSTPSKPTVQTSELHSSSTAPTSSERLTPDPDSVSPIQEVTTLSTPAPEPGPSRPSSPSVSKIKYTGKEGGGWL